LRLPRDACAYALFGFYKESRAGFSKGVKMSNPPFNNTIAPVKLSQILFPTYVSMTGVTATDKNQNAFVSSLDIYGGFVQTAVTEGQGNTQRYTFRSFIPIDDKFNVLTYDPDGPIFDVATTVSLAATSPNGAHVAIESIDAAHAKLSNQLGQSVLLLEFDLGLRWTEIINVAYSVNVLYANSVGTRNVVGQLTATAAPQ
jgi:hypothetical protein